MQKLEFISCLNKSLKLKDLGIFLLLTTELF